MTHAQASVPLGSLAALLLAGAAAQAAPPPGADPALYPFFHSLRVPGGPYAGTSCCSVADCRPTETRSKGSGFEARTPEGNWVTVPPETVLHRLDNPTGEPILCWTKYHGVYCFIAGPQT